MIAQSNQDLLSETVYNGAERGSAGMDRREATAGVAGTLTLKSCNQTTRRAPALAGITPATLVSYFSLRPNPVDPPTGTWFLSPPPPFPTFDLF